MPRLRTKAAETATPPPVVPPVAHGPAVVPTEPVRAAATRMVDQCVHDWDGPPVNVCLCMCTRCFRDLGVCTCPHCHGCGYDAGR